MNNNSWSISIHNDVYPKLLREIYNPPQKLYYKGKIEVLNKPCVAVVGTRKSTEYGPFWI
jgi:DNA processing protein